METSASLEARYAPLLYPTNQVPSTSGSALFLKLDRELKSEGSQIVQVGDPDYGEVWNRLPDPRSNVAVMVERRMYLAALWKEICELRPLQRVALLLNLHDSNGQDMLRLLVLVNVARLSEIAASLDLPVQELAELWGGLPLDDTAIARRLGVTRQQVINLRKSARERLARRMAKSW